MSDPILTVDWRREVASLRAQLETAEQENERLCKSLAHWEHCHGVTADRLEAAEQENERLKAVADLAKRIAARMPLCADHRDKFDGLPCPACSKEAAEQRVSALQQERDALRDVLTECEASIRRMAMRLNEEPGNQTTVALWLYLADKARALLAGPRQ